MMRKMISSLVGGLLLLPWACYSAAGEVNTPLPIFDTHVHYSNNSREQYTPVEIIEKMTRANVPRALVSSSPDDNTRLLYELDPERVVPFLRPYHEQITSGNWMKQDAVIPYLETRLQTPIYAGIGEFHLHNDQHADASTVKLTVQMAVERDLFLHVHSNARAVRTIFTYSPEVKILWAHAGMTESPEIVSEMLDQYPQLWVDTSIREHDIAPQGKLDPQWRALFIKHADRITIGSDTWVPYQWDKYQAILDFDRGWLAQLPRDVAEKIAFRNAVRLFGAGSHGQLQ